MADAATCLIRCEGVQRTYPDGNVTALADVTLNIDRGEYIAIVGPSGSGKSTLMNLISGLDQPTGGTIYFDGTPLSDSGHRSRIRVDRVGFIFQAFHLLPTLSACENVQIPMFETVSSPKERQRRAAELLERVGMGHRLNHLPPQLSGGERQRVAIARALANNPLVLIADEPTGNLDTVTGEEILKLFDQLHQDRQMTIIVVTHSLEVSERSHRLIRIRDGRIIDDRRRN